MKFKVIRAHTGDRDYAVGDQREASLVDVQHLVPKTLVPLEAEKSEQQHANKAEVAPLNKSNKARNGESKKKQA